MLTRLALIALTSMVPFLVTPSFAESPIVVVTENYPPFNYEHAGQLRGLSTKLVQQVLDNTGLQYEIKLFPWPRAFKMASNKSNKNTLIYSISRTQEREDDFDWLLKLASGKTYIMSRNEPDIDETELNNPARKAVCVYQDAACEFFENIGFRGDRLVTVSDNQSSSEKRVVLAGRADFFIAGSASLAYRLRQLGLKEEQFKRIKLANSGKGLYLAASKSVDKNIRDRIRKTVTNMLQQGTIAEIDSNSN